MLLHVVGALVGLPAIVKSGGGARGARQYEEGVKDLLSHVEADYKAQCEDILLGRSFTFSQVWQDWIIYHNFFKSHTPRWGAGTYIDVSQQGLVSLFYRVPSLTEDLPSNPV